MAASNSKVADLLRRYASALVLERADRFKVKAYRKAADNIELLDVDIGKLVERGDDLQSIPGVGKAIGHAVQEILATGSMPQLETLLSHTSPELAELAGHPRLDPAKVARIYKKLKIGSIEELRHRLQTGEIQDVFGSRIAFHVRHGLDERPRILLYRAEPLADTIEAYLRTLPGVGAVARVGSLRRKQETVGDLTFLVQTRSAPATFRRFAEFGGITPLEAPLGQLGKGQPRNGQFRNDQFRNDQFRNDPPGSRQAGRFRLSSGTEVTLVPASGKVWGMELILRTGSELHLNDLQEMAAKQERLLSVAGFEKLGLKMHDERQVYRALGLSYVEPELREGRGEVEQAATGDLPKLVTRDDLRGDLHMHTTASDGANSIAEMAEAAQERGYEYIAITDHSQSLRIANGLSEERLLKHIRDIDRANSKLKGLRILKSAEVDILQDGSLDYSNDMLRELDLTICSIHSRFGLNREQQTARILRAMDNPYFTILGHATGRLLLKREGYELDIERVLQHARARGCFVEINSSPDRLDLSDEHARMAKELGIKIAINTDAHAIDELDLIPWGVNQARRGWLTPDDVLNTRTLTDLLKMLQR